MTSFPATSGIYQITCTVTGKFYIGSAVNLYHRRVCHFNDLQHGKHRNSKLQRAWNKYGPDAFTFEVLELVLTPFLLEREQCWLDKLKPFKDKGFNIHPTAGSRIGAEVSPATRAKLRDANLGRKDSEETIRKRVNAMKGRSQSQETIRKRMLSRQGYSPSAETRARLSVVNTGKWQDPEWNASQMKTLIITAPDGTEYHVHGIKRFCREHHLNISALTRVAQCKQKQHKGWKARYPE